MSVSLAVLVLFTITVVLVVLPLIPALVEWRARTDVEPLRVVQQSEVDVRHLARGFRDHVVRSFEPILAECRESGATREGELEDGTRYIVTGDAQAPVLNEAEERKGSTERLLLGCADLTLPANTLFLKEIYARGSVRGAARSVYRAILADVDVRIGPSSRSLRWLHADQGVYAEAGCVLHGRVSADQWITLEDGCGFERLHAPRVELGGRPGPATNATPKSEDGRPSAVLQPEDLPNLVEVEAGRWLVEKELDVPPNVRVEADLVVTGHGRIREGSCIVGSVKSHADLFLERGVRVEGSVVSGRALFIGPECRVRGPLLAEGEMRIDSGSVVGTASGLTTVSARDIYAALGVLVHGTVWAHVDGWVSSAVSGSWSTKVA